MRLDDKGRCPNCLKKPIAYRREKHFFCHVCCRSYDMPAGTQKQNWAWHMIEGEWRPTYPDDGKPDHYMHAKPTAAALRRL